MRIVLTYIIFEATLEIKSGGFKFGECGAYSISHLQLIRRFPKRCLSHCKVLFERWGVAPSCWNYWPSLSKFLCRPNVVESLCDTSMYHWEFTMSNSSLSSSNQYGSTIPCFHMATQAVHNACCRQSSGRVEPQQMLFFEFTCPERRKCASSKNHKSSSVLITLVTEPTTQSHMLLHVSSSNFMLNLHPVRV